MKEEFGKPDPSRYGNHIGPQGPDEAPYVWIFGLIFWLLLFSCCGGFGYYDIGSRNEARNNEISHKMQIVENNNNQFKVIAIYPEYGHKGRFIGHYAICEGLTDKTRLKIFASTLPVPGEVWEINVVRNEYVFTKLVK